ncbi:MAG: silent information regulator protein Sir2, partial [Spirochaetales bacterium]|nr:silent information regulator protein Sir2 [Spirochaetales bacterium]
LEEQGRVHRIITQNIDRLHQRAGSKKIFECHGTYDTGRCRQCGKTYKYSYYEGSLGKGEIPRCNCGGVIKPDVVFFGESLPEEFYRLWENPPQGDLLLILGTSLNVRPAADLALKLAGRMKSILINRDRTDYDSLMDYTIHEDLDTFVNSL